MRRRSTALSTSLTLFASLLVAVALPASPAVAHTGGTINPATDSASSDGTVLATDGTPLKIRILLPTATKPTGGWPLITYVHGGGGSRCLNDAYTRQQLAGHGFVVVSFNGRGAPTSPFAGTEASFGDTVSCDETTNMIDSIDDGGHDFGGPKDRQDISDVISWMMYFYAPANCETGGAGGSNNCTVNRGKVGVMGASYGGGRSWMMGLPDAPPCNTVLPGGAQLWDCQVEAIVPQAASLLFTTPPAAVSSHLVDRGTEAWSNLIQDAGHAGHTHPDVAAAYTARVKADYLNQPLDSVNTNGTVSSGSLNTVTIGSSSFTAADVGKPITIAQLGVSGMALHTTIAGFTNATTVTLTKSATTAGSGKRVSWGSQAWWDMRTIVDANADIENVDKIAVPTFVAGGWLDVNGFWGTSTLMAIEAFKRLPSTTPRFLYLGDCYHSSPCHAANRTRLRDTLHRFLDRYVRLDTSVNVSNSGNCAQTYPCVFHAVPPVTPYTDTDWDALAEDTTWPPSSVPSYTYHLRWATTSGSISPTAPTGSDVASKTIENKAVTPPSAAVCVVTSNYDPSSEVQVYDADVNTSTEKVYKMQADIALSSSSTRMQVGLDVYTVNSGGVETRVWAGAGITVPNARSVTPDAVEHFVFQPGEAAFTIPNGHKLRVKVVSKFASLYTAEHVPATYTVWHKPNDASKQSTITFWLV